MRFLIQNLQRSYDVGCPAKKTFLVTQFSSDISRVTLQTALPFQHQSSMESPHQHSLLSQLALYPNPLFSNRVESKHFILIHPSDPHSTPNLYASGPGPVEQVKLPHQRKALMHSRGHPHWTPSLAAAEDSINHNIICLPVVLINILL